MIKNKNKLISKTFIYVEGKLFQSSNFYL